MADPKLVYNRYQPPLKNPVPTATVVGSVGTTTYTYTVTAVNECGETDGASVTVTDAPDSLSTASYVSLSWDPVDRARCYRIYRDGAFLYETDQTSFDDTGAYTPDSSRTPPPYNETEEFKYLLWDSVAFVPGYAQAAEVNELQEILAEKIKRLGDTLFREGNLIKGCSLHIASDGTTNISEGYIYALGAIRYVPSATLSIPTSGTYYVGVNASISYIDSNDNEYLLDPAQNYPGYGLSGAYRRVVELSWTYDEDPENLDIPVWKIIDGTPTLYIQGIQYGELEVTLARRDNDFHGQTLIEGFDVRVLPHESYRDKVTFEIEPGKAYVNGYEIVKIGQTKLDADIAKQLGDTVQEELSPLSGLKYKPDQVPVGVVSQVTIRVKVTETRTVPSTQDACGWYFDDTGVSLDSILGVWTDSSKTTAYTFSNTDPGCTGRDPGTAQVYLSGSGFALDPNTFTPGNTYYIEYLKYYTAVKGVRQKAYQEDGFTYNSSTSTYNLSKTDVINSKRSPVVVVDENEVTYTEGVDYEVDTGRTDTTIGTASITWLPGGNTPSDGTVFYVRYYYWDHVEEGDYVAVDSYVTDFSSYDYDDIEDPDLIDFRTSGTKPASENTSIIVSYQPFLSEWAWLTLDSKGEFTLLRGQPARLPSKPSRPLNVLPRYLLYLPAFSQTIDLYEEARYKVKKTYDINALEDRVERLEYNVALSLLEQEAQAKHTVGPKRAIFTDSFTSPLAMADESDVSLNTSVGEMSLKIEWEPVATSYDTSSSTGVRFNNQTITLPFTEVGFDSQLIWTEDFAQEVNPYAVVGPVTEVELHPSSDFWVERSVDVTVTTVTTRTIRRSASGMLRNWQAQHMSRKQLAEWVHRNWGLDPRWIMNGRWGRDPHEFFFSGETVNEVYQVTDIDLIPTLRRRQVIAIIRGCPPNEDNISATFDGKPVSLSIATSTDLANAGLSVSPTGSSGTTPGTVKADSKGTVTAKFTIPPNIPTGTREFKVTSPSGLVNGSALYRGLGWVQHMKRIREVTRIRGRLWFPDPVAQTFTVDSDIFVTSVDLWFYAVPESGNNGVEVLIKNLTEDGEPGGTVYGRTYLSKEEIMSQMGISSASKRITTPSESNKVRFTFSDPVYLPPGQYCVCVASQSNGYFVYVARLGKKILGNLGNVAWAKIGQTLNKQPHRGVLFLSYNGVSWEIDQESDLMFRINKAQFDASQIGRVLISVSSASAEYSHIAHILHPTTPPGTDLATSFKAGTSTMWTYYDAVFVDPREGKDDVERDMIPLGMRTNSLTLRAELVSSNPDVSPMLAKDVNFLYVYRYSSPSTYISKEVNISPDSFSNIKMWIERSLNSGSVTYEVSFDSGATWYTLPTVGVLDVGNNWEEVELGGDLSTVTGGALTEASKFMLRITISYGTGYEHLSPLHRKLRVVVF